MLLYLLYVIQSCLFISSHFPILKKLFMTLLFYFLIYIHVLKRLQSNQKAPEKQYQGTLITCLLRHGSGTRCMRLLLTRKSSQPPEGQMPEQLGPLAAQRDMAGFLLS